MREQIQQPHSPVIQQNEYQSINVNQVQESKELATYLSSKRFIYGNNICQKMFASWVTPIVDFGYKRPMNPNYIGQLKENDRINKQYQKFRQIFNEQRAKGQDKQGIILLKTIIKYQFKQQLIYLLVTAFILLCKITMLIFNQTLINYIENRDQRDSSNNLKYFLYYAFLVFFEMITTNCLFYYYQVLDRDLSYILSLMVYGKVLRYPFLCSKQYDLAQIVNLSQTDAYRLKSVHWGLTISIYSTIYVTVCIGLVYYFIGPISLVCIPVFGVLIYFSFAFFQILQQKQTQFYEAKDKTTNVTEQILNLINFIKYNVLQKYFLQKAARKRQEQLSILSLTCLLKTTINFIYSMVSPALVVTLFLLYIQFNKEHVSTAQVFLVLTIFSNIQVLAQDFPQWFNFLIIGWIAIKRIQKFLLTAEINQDRCISAEATRSKNAIEIVNTSFLWEQAQQHLQQIQEDKQIDEQFAEADKSSDNTIKTKKIFSNINLQFEAGKMTIIFGKVGSGKTSLIQAILNEMKVQKQTNSKVCIHGSIAYVSQKPWIFQGTVKQNIVFFSDYDELRFRQAVYFSCLQDDIKTFKKGADTEVGQKGANLSGGQRARIGLARALYQNKDIYILDDTLSALDVHVANFIFQNTFKTYLKQKTVIFATHDKKLAFQGDFICKIYNTKVQMIKANERKYDQKILQSSAKAKRGMSIETKPSIINEVQLNLLKTKNPQQPSEIGMILAEDQATGDIPSHYYKEILDLNGSKIIILAILILFGLWSYLSYLGNVKIQNWCNDEDHNKTYLYLYIGLIFTSGVLLSIACYLIQLCQINKNKKLHSNIMVSIIYASITQFFHRVPSGRILNRLTNDLTNVDFINFHQIKPFLISFFSIVSCFIACVFASQILVLIPIGILVVTFILYFLYFIKSQQQCLRLQKISNSHIITGITETITGLDVIRANQKMEKMLQSQIGKVEDTRSISITKLTLQYWILIRNSMIAYITILCIVAYCIFNKDKTGAELGIILLYASTFNQQIGFIFPTCLSIRQRMIQFERVQDLCTMEPELGYNKSQNSQNQRQINSNNKPSNSVLQFVNYSAAYREDLQFCLKNINLKIHKRRKVGIVGRTGAGKSSLFNSILRIIEPAQGQLFIQGKEIRDYPVDALRSSITTIEQSPSIIDGTIRQNIDPNSIYTDDQLNQKLSECKLADLLQSKGGLYKNISNKSTSAGEKQLVSFCRAVLKNSSLILMDEATANINGEWSDIIQSIIYSHFSQSTVLIIAHKLATLEHCDQIVVLKEGEVVEWGATRQLLANPNSIYKSMLEHNSKQLLA